jgi:nicotinate-nucleotide adenylyltransferase
MTRRIGILGGTFDPIHVGHIDLVFAAQAALDLTSVVFVPAHVPPHRPVPVASAFHRFAMVVLALPETTTWKASDAELLDPAPSYTSKTLQRLHGEGYHPAELYFLIGSDAFSEIETWKDYPAILEMAHFAVVSRPGTSTKRVSEALPRLGGRLHGSAGEPSIILIDAPTTDVSSTAIRERRAAGLLIDALVPAPVCQHIERHGLYR